jgi:hypothetical protein
MNMRNVAFSAIALLLSAAALDCQARGVILGGWAPGAAPKASIGAGTGASVTGAAAASAKSSGATKSGGNKAGSVHGYSVTGNSTTATTAGGVPGALQRAPNGSIAHNGFAPGTLAPTKTGLLAQSRANGMQGIGNSLPGGQGIGNSQSGSSAAAGSSAHKKPGMRATSKVSTTDPGTAPTTRACASASGSSATCN